MAELDDHELLAEYARTGSEAAFAALVARYLNLVHSAALRFAGNPNHAEEITQAVFIILARKAGGLRRGVVLPGWLYQTARLTSANFLKAETRRQRREQEAYMQSTLGEPEAAAWEQIAPLLDEAMGRLGETDRNAVVLRYFENKSGQEVAATLKMNEAAAHKRVRRALEKLRKFFTNRGVALSATLIAGAVSANSVKAAPVALAKSVTAVGVAKGAAAGGSTLALIKGVLKIMAWTKAKMAVAVGVGVLLAAGTATVTVEKIHAHYQYYQAWQVFDTDQARKIMQTASPQVELVPTKFPDGNPRTHTISWITVESGGRGIGMNCPIGDIIRFAWSTNSDSVTTERLIVETKLPKGGYDFIATFKQGSRERVQLEIKQKLGLAGTIESRTVDVMALRQKAGYGGANAANILQGTVEVGQGEYELWHQKTTSELARHLDTWMRLPVVDQTGISNQFDLNVKWSPEGTNYAGPLKKVLLDQLGLELVPGQEPVDMLVVTK